MPLGTGMGAFFQIRVSARRRRRRPGKIGARLLAQKFAVSDFLCRTGLTASGSRLDGSCSPRCETRPADAHADKSKIALPWAAAAVPELPTALHDLTAAVRYPRRTFEYCRMAAEVVRRHFDPPRVKGHSERWREGELAMCAALLLTRESLQALDAVAARSRHGELVFSINWEMRKRALEFAWELVARFAAHLQGTSRDHWKLLDVRFEDH